jgi:hypothetical protein
MKRDEARFRSAISQDRIHRDETDDISVAARKPFQVRTARHVA